MYTTKSSSNEKKIRLFQVHVQADTQAPTPGQHIPPHPVLPERPNTSQSPSPTETSDEGINNKCTMQQLQ